MKLFILLSFDQLPPHVFSLDILRHYAISKARNNVSGVRIVLILALSALTGSVVNDTLPAMASAMR